LFEAAAEPKELRWYAGGHWPPPTAIEDVAGWLASELFALGDQRSVADNREA